MKGILKARTVAILTAFLMVFAMMPLTAGMAYAADEPTIDLKVTDATNASSIYSDKTGNDAQIGDRVDFKITADLKEDGQNYVIGATVTPGLTLQDLQDTNISFSNTGLGFGIDNAYIDENGNKGFAITFEGDPKNTTVTVQYSAVVNESADTAAKENINEAFLRYGDGKETAHVTTKTKTYPLQFKRIKKGDASEKALSGAKYEVYRAFDNSKIKFTKISDTEYQVDLEGTVTEIETVSETPITINGLSAENYVFVEKAAPDNYNLLETSVTVGETNYQHAQMATVSTTSGTGAVQVVKIEEENPVEPVSYSLWIGTEQVTSNNLSGEGNVGEKGTWTFTPANGDDPAILTLDNFEYEGAGYKSAAICGLDDKKLTILLKGTNTITFSQEDWAPGLGRDVAGIYKIGSLEIKDDPDDNGVGQLNAYAKGATDGVDQSRGIRICRGDLIINEGIVNAVSYDSKYASRGVSIEIGNMYINGGSLTAVGAKCSDPNESSGIFLSRDKLYIGEDVQKVSATGNKEAISGEVQNAVYGDAWNNVDGTGDPDTIMQVTEPRALPVYKKVVFPGTKHVHSFTYAAKANTITATCTRAMGCLDSYDKTPFAITLNAPTGLTYDGKAKAATITGYPETAVTGLAEEPSVIKYYKSEGPGSTTVSGNELTGAPVDAGDYVALIEWGGAIASAAFSIVKPAPAKISGTPFTTMKAKGKTGMTVAWEKVEGADGYDVFFSRCNHDDKKMNLKVAETIQGSNTLSWTTSGLKAGKTYKAYIKAYVMKDGKKQYVKTSPLMHAYANGYNKKHTNAKSVKVKKTKVSVKKGKTFKLKAKVKKLKKGKKLMPKSHVATVRYLSTDTSIATVSKKGKIKGVNKGTCYVYAYAHNGVFKKITVTVK